MRRGGERASAGRVKVCDLAARHTTAVLYEGEQELLGEERQREAGKSRERQGEAGRGRERYAHIAGGSEKINQRKTLLSQA